MRYTAKYLKILLKENDVSKTSNNVIPLMMLAVENNLISKDSILENSKEVRPVGRLRKYEKKEKKPTDPKYERLGLIRNNPLGVRITNVETGEVIEYGSTYESRKKMGHSWQYFENRDGKIEDGFKVEIFKKAWFETFHVSKGS